MTVINGYTAEHMQALIDSMIVGGSVVGGDLILEQHDGGEVNAGDIRGGQQIPHTKATTVNSTGSESGSTSMVNFGVGLSIAGFVKYRADTKLILEIATGVFNDDALGYYEVGISIGGTVYEMFNGYSDVGAKSGIYELPGLAAGTYTLTAKKRCGLSSVGNVSDGTAGARNSMKVTETF